MESYLDRNNSRLEKRLKSIMARKDKFLKESMQEVLIWAANRALDLHVELEGGRHQLHLVIGDSYGWALVHDGKIVSMDVTATGNNIGNATKALKDEASLCPSIGWCGIVLAGMQTKYGSPYIIRFENEVLQKLAHETEENYMDIIKEVKFV